MSDKYILKDGQPVKCDDLMEWAQWYETADRKIAYAEKNGVRVDTIFLSLDHNWGPGEPILFETRVFGGKYDQELERYETIESARLGHADMCRLVGIEQQKEAR